jgi:hypothetical protein
MTQFFQIVTLARMSNELGSGDSMDAHEFMTLISVTLVA